MLVFFVTARLGVEWRSGLSAEVVVLSHTFLRVGEVSQHRPAAGLDSYLLGREEGGEQDV